MKYTIRLFLFVGVLFLPAIASAQGSGSYEPSPRPSSSDKIGDESSFEVNRTTSGSIVGIKDGILTIKTNKDQEISIAVIKETKFKVGKKAIDVNELDENMFAEGKKVKITYRPFLDKRTKIDKVALVVSFDAENGPGLKPKIG